MADKKEKKSRSLGAYAIIAGILVAVVLVGVTIFAFTSRYAAFDPEKTAKNYVELIAESADGYNSYKTTLLSKNQKHGDFIVNAYMTPYINEDAEQNEIIGSKSKKEAKLLDKVYSTMYDYYVELIENNGMDNYDAVYSQYFAKLAQVRKDIIGDDYMDTEFMFGVFESNIDQYSKSLIGVKEELEADNKTVKTPAKDGKYHKLFGKDYKLSTTVKATKELDEKEVKAYVKSYKERIDSYIKLGTRRANELDLTKEQKESMISAFEKLDCSEKISSVMECTVVVNEKTKGEVASVKVYVVKIGSSWYVDNTNIDTSVLYF